MTSAADVTVVIPTRDRWPILRRTLAALQAQTVSGFDIVVVVDGTDQQPPQLPGARVIEVEHGGPGAARNAGASAATTSHLLFLGDDMIPRPDLLARHLAVHTRRPESSTAVLGHVEWHKEVPRTPLRAWIDDTGMQFDLRSIEGDDAGWARFYSCNVSLNRAFFLEAGGFDPDFTYYYEDLDAGWRLHQHGMQLVYARDAIADHLHTYEPERYAGRMRGVAVGERMMAAKHDWFQPWFAEKFRAVEGTKPPSRAWQRAAGVRLPGSLGAAVRRRASLAWLARFSPVFLDAFEAPEELEELQDYLGDRYDPALLQRHQQAVDEEEHAAPDELTFYRTSQTYLYDLTVFAMSGTKRPYRSLVRRLVGPGARVLDYGCGIGSDGLRLINAGLAVEFADFDNPSVDYLRWRLARRGISATIHDVEKPIDARFALVYCFDVIEHVDDPFGFLERLEHLADIVVVNFLEPTPDDVHVHKPLPIAQLLDHAVRRGMISYRLMHGRSHLVAYRGAGSEAGPGARAIGRLRIVRDRFRQERARR